MLPSMKAKVHTERYVKGDCKIVVNYAMPQERLMTAAMYLNGKKVDFTTDVDKVTEWMRGA